MLERTRKGRAKGTWREELWERTQPAVGRHSYCHPVAQWRSGHWKIHSYPSLPLLPPSHFLPVFPVCETQLDSRAQGSPADAIHKCQPPVLMVEWRRMENGSEKTNGNYPAGDACFEMQVPGPQARPIEAPGASSHSSR